MLRGKQRMTTEQIIVKLQARGHSFQDAQAIAEDLMNEIRSEQKKKLIHSVLNWGFLVITAGWIFLFG